MYVCVYCVLSRVCRGRRACDYTRTWAENGPCRCGKNEKRYHKYIIIIVIEPSSSSVATTTPSTRRRTRARTFRRAHRVCRRVHTEHNNTISHLYITIAKILISFQNKKRKNDIKILKMHVKIHF